MHGRHPRASPNRQRDTIFVTDSRKARITDYHYSSYNAFLNGRLISPSTIIVRWRFAEVLCRSEAACSPAKISQIDIRVLTKIVSIVALLISTFLIAGSLVYRTGCTTRSLVTV
jgi:hypothetical protein